MLRVIIKCDGRRCRKVWRVCVLAFYYPIDTVAAAAYHGNLSASSLGNINEEKKKYKFNIKAHRYPDISSKYETWIANGVNLFISPEKVKLKQNENSLSII